MIEPDPAPLVVRIEKVTVVDPVKPPKAEGAVNVVGVDTVMLASAATFAVTVVVAVRIVWAERVPAASVVSTLRAAAGSGPPVVRTPLLGRYPSLASSCLIGFVCLKSNPCASNFDAPLLEALRASHSHKHLKE